MDLTSLALRQRLFVAYKHTKWNFFGIFLTFVCTLALFPAYMSKIQPAYPSINYPQTIWTDRLYAQVMTFLLFNLGDTLGRMISSKIQIPSLLRARLLFFLCALRFLFIPLFGFCHFPNTNGYPYVFKNDFIYALIVLFFAMSHGYCNSINMMYAPRRVHAQLSSTVGALMLMVCMEVTSLSKNDEES
jgi:equilibrative nucleoside transporter 1/2/3